MCRAVLIRFPEYPASSRHLDQENPESAADLARPADLEGCRQRVASECRVHQGFPVRRVPELRPELPVEGPAV
jgi:hypothetical protein